jgi:phospholipid/cholesterol/gamma-HCH transport system substrate-binding protein
MVALADRNLQNLEGFTKPLGERGDELVLKVDQTVGRLDELLEQFVTFGKALNRREGSLGQLVNNPDLYQHLDSAARNIDQLTRELKPIVRDARVLSDTLARHPETLGVRGAIKPRSGIK